MSKPDIYELNFTKLSKPVSTTLNIKKTHLNQFLKSV